MSTRPLRVPARLVGVIVAVAAVALATGGAAAARDEDLVVAPVVEGAGAGQCSLGDCGTAELDPAWAPVGAPVAVTVDHAYFGSFDADDGLSVLLTVVGGYVLPGAGTLAPLTFTDEQRATFRVPELHPGSYEVRFSQNGDEAFGQPVVREPFVVISGGLPATDTAPEGGRQQGREGLLALAAGIVALLIMLRPGGAVRTGIGSGGMRR